MSFHRSAARPFLSVRALWLTGIFVAGLVGSPAGVRAQELVPALPSYAPPDDDLVRAVPRTRVAIEAEIARLEAIDLSIDSEGSSFAVEIGTQLMVYGTLLTLLGLAIEAIAQSLSVEPWSQPPWIFLGAGSAGGVLAAIGVPTFTIALSDPGYRREGRASRRIQTLRQELYGLDE